ncbi:hypothetical protein [Rhizobium alvei]|uniref:NinB protein n=1 Tax=Rhizobium alvei TaxID=1132659 RepID=A0ABT8YUJ7_9HYPH|nr:hypothetical protein [Rhizobium alvei]MDO6966939.1 hypothetical protein [Rhizobium alvei]
MRKKEKPPLIQVQMTPRGLRPLTPDDAEKMARLAQGSIYEITPTSKRSSKQLRTYWKALGLVVRTTGKWSTAENLHRDLKITLGYCEQAVNMRTGEITLVPDSAALDRMSPEEFNAYMTRAMATLSDAVGYDPLAFLSEEMAA